MIRTGMSVCLLCWALSSLAQTTFTEEGRKYPLSTESSKYVVSGFASFDGITDETIFANAVLWAIEHVCPQLKEGITEMKVAAKSFACDMVLSAPAGSGQSATYYCKAVFRVAAGKLTFHLSQISVEAPILVVKKNTPLEKLSPDKKDSHRQTLDDFVESESQVLNEMFDFIVENRPSDITHWQEIGIGKAVEGMTEDECRLAFGKPQTVMESNGEVQWMYNSSFYLFFRNGKLTTIIK